MPTMSMADWLEMARDFPTQAEAEAYRQKHGIRIGQEPTVNYSEYGELPPVGGLSAAQNQEVDTGAMGGPDEEDEVTLGALAAADDGSLDFTKLNDPSVFNRMYASQRRATAAQDQSAKQLFEQARTKLMQRYAGPTRSDQLLAISSAMLAPRKVPGFKGFLGSMVNTSLGISQAQQQAERQREEQLMALQQQYQTGTAARAAAQQQGTLELLRTYGSLNKPAKQRTGFNPVTGQLMDMDTGLPVTPPPPTIGEVRRGYQYVGGDPAKQTSWRKVM